MIAGKLASVTVKVVGTVVSTLAVKLVPAAIPSRSVEADAAEVDLFVVIPAGGGGGFSGE